MIIFMLEHQLILVRVEGGGGRVGEQGIFRQGSDQAAAECWRSSVTSTSASYVKFHVTSFTQDSDISNRVFRHVVGDNDGGEGM
jgi:hypothetical protein